MKRLFQFNGSIIATFLVMLASQFGFAQDQVVINKQIIEDSTNCQQFDVTLSITGNPPIQPQEVVLLIDNSGSMNDAVTVGGETKTLLEFAQEAAIDFVNNIFSTVNDPNDLNRVAIVSYNTFANIEVNLTNSSGQQTLINEINSITAGGGTNIEDAFVKANEVLSPPGTQGTFDCATSRSIILLTDGVATFDNTNTNTNPTVNQCDPETLNTQCQTRAIAAADAIETITLGGVEYEQQIFTVGFTGALNSNELVVSQNTLNTIENSGAFYTNNAADLTGIYNTILGQLLAAATALDGQSLVNDVIPNNFQIVANSLMTTKGTYTVTGQQIDWFIDRVVNETVTLSYSIMATAEECGITDPGTSTINFRDTNCNAVSETFENPEVCVPCPEATITLAKNGCKSVDFSSSINQVSCTPTSENYSWKFFLDGVEIDSSDIAGGIPTTDSGTFVYIGTNDFSGTFTAELDYQGFYESSCPATIVEDSTTLAVDCSSDLSLKIAINNPLPKVGDTIIYTLIIKNDGPEEASDIEVTNVLPSGLTYNTTGSNNVPTGTNFDNGSGVWDLNSVTIPNGNSIQLSLAVTVNGAGIFTNTAEITKAINEDDLDSTPGNSN